MQMRTLGGTGIKVSPYCLGAMMFGAWGNTDHADSARIIHAALDAGINFVDTADVYSAGESEEIVGEALQGRREHVGQLAALDRARSRGQPAAPPHRLHRPVPDAPARPVHRHRRNPVGTVGP